MNRFSRIILGLGIVVSLTVVGAGAASAARHATSAPVYLALGDSVAAGYQNGSISTDRACTNTTQDLKGDEGYSCLLYARMKAVQPTLQYVNLAIAVSPGEDSCSFQASSNCLGQPNSSRVDAAPGDTAPYNIGTTYQLQAMEQFLANPANNVQVISLSLGGNDFLPLLHVAEQADCSTLPPGWAAYENPNCVTAAQGILANIIGPQLQNNLGTIVGTIRHFNTTAPLLLGDQYDPLVGLPASAFGPNGAAIEALALGALGPGTQAHPGFQALIQGLAAHFSATPVDEFDAITSGATQTWVTSSQNIHPNATGYTLLANAYWASYVGATGGETGSVKAPKKIKDGKTASFRITTLPASTVTTTINYKKGKKTHTVTLTGVVSDVSTRLTQTWKVPKGAIGKASYQIVASVGGKAKELTGHVTLIK